MRKLLPDAAPEMDVQMWLLHNTHTHTNSWGTHWQSPSFFAYFPMNAISVGFMGEMLSAGLNVVPII
jgi:aromatic-L-amino-acid/L-tryptophan decarboxylase